MASPRESLLTCELKYAQENCESPVRVYLGMASGIGKAVTEERLADAGKIATCRAGHNAAVPIEIVASEIASAIE